MSIKNKHKTLLILDLDETLIHATTQPLERPADFMVSHYNVYQRPYLDFFLEQVKHHFLLAIWSSASDDYVAEVVKQILPTNLALEFIWGRSRCTIRRNISTDEYGYYTDYYSSHHHYLKPLKKVKRRGFSLDRILIVDDSPHKVERNFGNAIYPKAFLGDTEDKELKLLATYLLKLKDKTEVRHIEKRNWKNKSKP